MALPHLCLASLIRPSCVEGLMQHIYERTHMNSCCGAHKTYIWSTLSCTQLSCSDLLQIIKIKLTTKRLHCFTTEEHLISLVWSLFSIKKTITKFLCLILPNSCASVYQIPVPPFTKFLCLHGEKLFSCDRRSTTNESNSAKSTRFFIKL